MSVRFELCACNENTKLWLYLIYSVGNNNEGDPVGVPAAVEEIYGANGSRLGFISSESGWVLGLRLAGARLDVDIVLNSVPV